MDKIRKIILTLAVFTLMIIAGCFGNNKDAKAAEVASPSALTILNDTIPDSKYGCMGNYARTSDMYDSMCVYVGEKINLKLDGSGSYVFKSENTKIATVSDIGVIKTKKAGSCFVYITDKVYGNKTKLKVDIAKVSDKKYERILRICYNARIKGTPKTILSFKKYPLKDILKAFGVDTKSKTDSQGLFKVNSNRKVLWKSAFMRFTSRELNICRAMSSNAGRLDLITIQGLKAAQKRGYAIFEVKKRTAQGYNGADKMTAKQYKWAEKKCYAFADKCKKETNEFLKHPQNNTTIYKYATDDYNMLIAAGVNEQEINDYILLQITGREIYKSLCVTSKKEWKAQIKEWNRLEKLNREQRNYNCKNDNIYQFFKYGYKYDGIRQDVIESMTLLVLERLGFKYNDSCVSFYGKWYSYYIKGTYGNQLLLLDDSYLEQHMEGYAILLGQRGTAVGSFGGKIIQNPYLVEKLGAEPTRNETELERQENRDAHRQKCINITKNVGMN